MLHTDDFNFDLPEDLIASRPLERRDGARMIVVHRGSGQIEHRQFTDFPEYAAGSLIVLNNVRVARARFLSPDERVEVLRLEAPEPALWHCMVRPGKRFRIGAVVEIGGGSGVVTDIVADGTRIIRWSTVPDEQTHGHLALPPYMHRPDDASDITRYQTAFARTDRSDAVAAPTAGLHFTPEMLATLPHTFITLHVGAGTFLPVKVDTVAEHVMHSEKYEITPAAAQALNAAPRRLAVGTTVTRVLEHCARTEGKITPHQGATSIFLHPPCTFALTDAMLTNFHLPRSTLFMLVSAFGGMDLLRAAYAEAIREKYRFYSYGDCMLIL